MNYATPFIPSKWILGLPLSICFAVSSLEGQSLITHNRLVLGTETNRSASVRIGDLDGDQDLDIVVANGRHWPGQNFALFNDGRSRFPVMRPIGIDRSTSYACELADLDDDGDLDIATGNDRAPCNIFLNDGKGRFSLKGSYGEVSSVRSLTVADIDQDGDQDLLVTCRGNTNWIHLNDGKANFGRGIEFGTAKDSTIDVKVGDVNGDEHLDLVLANRDGQPNAWLLNDGKLNFSKSFSFGNPSSQSRAVVVGDFNGDDQLDWAVGNIGQPNCVFIGDGRGGVLKATKFGDSEERTYCLAAVDIDLDGDLDLLAGNAGQPNTVFFNNGDATRFDSENFGENNATYGLSVGDLNGDGLPDVAVANSDALNHVYINRIEPTRKGVLRSTQSGQQKDAQNKIKPPEEEQRILAEFQARADYRLTDWPSFRGVGGRGVAEGFELPQNWHVDPDSRKSKNVLWRINPPGLGHSSPVIAGDKVFLLTAIAADGKAPLQVEAGGKPTAAEDHGVQEWVLLCYQKKTGQEIWRRILRKGKPRATRHAKATHANTSVFVVGNTLVAFLGSEGLYCLDLDGNRLWSQDLGVVNISKYGIGWGFSSSPAVHNDRIVVVCDDPKKPFVAARRLHDGEEIWRTSRKGICERSWGSPLIHSTRDSTQIVVNGWPWIVSYDLANGKEIWRIQGGGDNPVPTPFEAHGLLYVTNAHGGPSPIFAIRPQARGDITSAISKKSGSIKNSSAIAWSVDRGGSYMSTPVVYGNQIYVGSAKGIIRSFDALNGKKIFEERLGIRAGVIASLVAGDKKVYCPSENGKVFVLGHGRKLNVLAVNKMDAPCLATPAISEGTIYFRTTKSLVAVRKIKTE